MITLLNFVEPSSLTGRWIRTTDGVVIKAEQKDRRTVTAFFPSEEITYSLEDLVLKPKQNHKKCQGHLVNNHLVQWTCPGKYDRHARAILGHGNIFTIIKIYRFTNVTDVQNLLFYMHIRNEAPKVL